jgi:predicted nucleic acid-binding protein
MSGRFLLDTNIVIAIFAKDLGVTDHLAEATEVFVPSIVLGELFYGARKSNQADANISRIEEFAADRLSLPLTPRRDGSTAVLRTTCESGGDLSQRTIFGLPRLLCSTD